jgi:hypothetical protein
MSVEAEIPQDSPKELKEFPVAELPTARRHVDV